MVQCRECKLSFAAGAPNFQTADEVKARHNKFNGHQATVIRHLDTPFEGLIA